MVSISGHQCYKCFTFATLEVLKFSNITISVVTVYHQVSVTAITTLLVYHYYSVPKLQCFPINAAVFLCFMVTRGSSVLQRHSASGSSILRVTVFVDSSKSVILLHCFHIPKLQYISGSRYKCWSVPRSLVQQWHRVSSLGENHRVIALAGGSSVSRRPAAQDDHSSPTPLPPTRPFSIPLSLSMWPSPTSPLIYAIFPDITLPPCGAFRYYSPLRYFPGLQPNPCNPLQHLFSHAVLPLTLLHPDNYSDIILPIQLPLSWDHT